MVATRHLTLMGQRQNLGFSSVMAQLRFDCCHMQEDDVTPVNADTPEGMLK